ncbi:MAG: hypothetical protein JWM68_3818 [Verrucomicrobiales bacterium]|nr:hypothetical protein [Verrucomicrobiales bacterium]
MRTRTGLIASLAVNLILGFGWYAATHKSESPSARIIPDSGRPLANSTNKPIAHPTKFTWHDVESADYAAYIKNLREIGCPQQTIRDIIVADVNQLYAHRRESEVQPVEFEWWKSDLDVGVQRKNSAKLNNLEAERKNMLTRLLGPNWEISLQDDTADHGGINLNGPVLGDISAETKQNVYEVTTRIQQEMKQLEDAAEKQGRPLDPNEVVRIRQQSRAELQRLLTPEQFEEFLLRYSETAKKMREEFRGVALTADEFRNLFRTRDPVEDQLAISSGANDARSIGLRQSLNAQRDAMLRATFGMERYETYKLNQDPLYRQAVTASQQAGVSSTMVAPIYQMNQATDAEVARIQNDASLSADEKSDAMVAAEVEREKSLEKLLGPEAYQKLQMQQILGPAANGPIEAPVTISPP